MKKINFKIKIKDLAGKEIEGYNAQQAVANIIASGQSKSPIRTIEIARKIFNDGTIELPSEDVLLVRNTIMESKNLTDLVKAQVLELLEDKK